MDKIVKTSLSILPVYILARSVEELYRFAPISGEFLGKFSIKWGLAAAGLLTGYFLLWLILLIWLWKPDRIDALTQPIANLRQRFKKLRWPFSILLAILPTIIFLFTSRGSSLFAGVYTRLVILLITSFILAVISTEDRNKLVDPANFLFMTLLLGNIHLVARHLTTVTNYPFSLSWSEGNRFYDYSIYLGGNRYIYPGKVPAAYYAPGRYLLWGIIFAFSNTPIWLHRLWNAVLWTIPYLLFGYALARQAKLNNKKKWIFILWVILFLYQAPIYPPLVLAALIIVVFVRPNQWLISFAGLLIASYYASSSRWTWMPAPTAWALLILLSKFEIRKQEGWLSIIWRLIPYILFTAAGLAAGTLAAPWLLKPQELTSGVTFSQPLLWYRLLPNATYSQGILFGALIATGPLILLLIWQVVSKRWPLNWLQQLAFAIACLGFLSIGLVASVKIGGGNNLHNLDTFFITLAVIAGLKVGNSADVSPPRVDKISASVRQWPIFANAVLIAVFLLPTWSIIQTGSPLHLPSTDEINEALLVIFTKANNFQEDGEVLFIDQRQLLTFGYMKNIRLVPDYEKKFLMDKAMAGDKFYYQDFYQDLADQRFSLIISEPLYLNEQDPSLGFHEENNAWVQWVAKPLLCYYAPIVTLPEVRVQLLVPVKKPTDCP